MKVAEFRTHSIKRTCTKQYNDYKLYDKALSKDFSKRCGYCNIKESTIAPVSFQVDHFIPQKAFKGVRDDLLCGYDNLVWSCPKCNRAKSNQFDGILTKKQATNTLFIKPDEEDYNKYFYRNEMGGIGAYDKVGVDLIARLKLFRIIHAYAWAYEQLEDIIQRANDGALKIKPEQLNKLYQNKDRIKNALNEAYKLNK